MSNLAQILMQIWILAFSISLNKYIDIKRQKYCSQKIDREEGEIYQQRYGDKTYALTFFPLSFSILLLDQQLFSTALGNDCYRWLIFFTFATWIHIAIANIWISQPKNGGSATIYVLFNTVSFVWLFGVASFFISNFISNRIK